MLKNDPGSDRTDTDLGSRQVQQDANLPVRARCGGSDRDEQFCQLANVRVGRVEAHDIDSRLDQPVEKIRRVRGGTKSCDDLRTAH
jgi:hypothetical protein